MNFFYHLRAASNCVSPNLSTAACFGILVFLGLIIVAHLCCTHESVAVLAVSAFASPSHGAEIDKKVDFRKTFLAQRRKKIKLLRPGLLTAERRRGGKKNSNVQVVKKKTIKLIVCRQKGEKSVVTGGNKGSLTSCGGRSQAGGFPETHSRISIYSIWSQTPCRFTALIPSNSVCLPDCGVVVHFTSLVVLLAWGCNQSGKRTNTQAQPNLLDLRNLLTTDVRLCEKVNDSWLANTSRAAQRQCSLVSQGAAVCYS